MVAEAIVSKQRTPLPHPPPRSRLLVTGYGLGLLHMRVGVCWPQLMDTCTHSHPVRTHMPPCVH